MEMMAKTTSVPALAMRATGWMKTTEEKEETMMNFRRSSGRVGEDEPVKRFDRHHPQAHQGYRVPT